MRLETDDSLRRRILAEVDRRRMAFPINAEIYTAIGLRLDALASDFLLERGKDSTPAILDGGPAFSGRTGEIPGTTWPGMSLRDYFAAAALPVLIKDAFEHNQRMLERNFVKADRVEASAYLQVDFDEMAAKAYVAADKMLEARKR